jgi:hypothetical protein
VSAAGKGDDAGAEGTTGFAENVKKASHIVGAGSTVVLVGPFDLTAFRFNIGVRIFSAGTSIDVTVRDQKGALSERLFLFRMGPTSFSSTTRAAFWEGSHPTRATQSPFRERRPRDSLRHNNDNTTNDPALQDPQPILPTQSGTIF